MNDSRDTTPAVGTPGEPAFGEKRPGETVDLHIGMWKDGRWSYLYKEDTQYGARAPDLEVIRDAARRARTGPPPATVQGPMLHPAVWTWEVPLYFWFGGMAAGAAFAALAADLAGDERAASIARRVALGALVPSPPLLIKDLGRPLRFHHMLRVFKPRSPMNTGAWALTAFGNLAAGAVGADLLGRRRLATLLGGANALVGGYLGSYTGVLLASTAVPLWARSRLFLGPIFVATGTASGAAAVRLALRATGYDADSATERALGRVETGAMSAELLLASVNERRLGPLAHGLHEGRPGLFYRAAKWGARAGLAGRASRRQVVRDATSGLFLACALLFRYAWVEAGKHNAREDRVVAEMARSARDGT